ncbi:hypothetical protein Halru_2550 [Halovivax ruber XH-70]|uniref:Uncharacterized protein n=1 Tax=Halovivax ruber (strain DSM 18193 / JCM 13892 / XH-70) TaxID=797302 RepID=L0IFX4_HALRX|nr:hypothetical protein [Halovivax ruber]AGB17131.1 hypothetical protein Halru_2550 [Halovivax ruber XH-70]
MARDERSEASSNAASDDGDPKEGKYDKYVDKLLDVLGLLT